MGTNIDVVNVANSLLGQGGVYQYGATGPTNFDCSGFTQFCYQNGAQINIGRDTNAQIAYNGPGVNTYYDAAKTPAPPTTIAGMIPGDLIFWGKVGDGGPNAHVQMYIGSNKIIEAAGGNGNPVPTVSNLDFSGRNVGGLPVRAVKRMMAGDSGGAPPAQTTTGTNSGVAPALNPNELIDSTLAAATGAPQDLPDPRNNLPFSKAFLSTPTLQAGGDFPLVRGGISELDTYGKRPRGQFACYFMMNPAAIDQSYLMDQAIPVQQSLSPDVQAVSSYPMQNQQWNFTLFFNRMYEVWNGDVPGPSQYGVRWDVRALERLMGLFDDIAVGSSANSSGGKTAPIGLPVQVVTGGINSFWFQGIMNSVSVEYTRFDRGMIPTECQVDIGMIKVYVPPKGLDLVNALVQAYSPTGANVAIPVSNPSVPLGLRRTQ